MGKSVPTHSRWLPALLAGCIALSVVVLAPPPPAQAAPSRSSFEACLLEGVNDARAAAGRAPVQMAQDLVPQVRDWSEWMRFNDFEHMSSSRRDQILPSSWTIWAENIAWHGNPNLPDCDAVHQMWMNSPGHRANILNASMRFVAIGTYQDSSGWWATQLFFDASNYPMSCNGTFCDDDGSVFEDSIETIAAAGITQGCNPPTNNRYCPDDRVTRGEMAAFMARTLDLSSGPGPSFVDDDNSIFEADIERIARAGITLGCNPPTNNRYCPNDYVTRGEMAAFLQRALGLPGSNSNDFIDDNNSQFESSIQAIATAGITQGCNPPTNDRYCPNGYVTRGQMAAFLARVLARA